MNSIGYSVSGGARPALAGATPRATAQKYRGAFEAVAAVAGAIALVSRSNPTIGLACLVAAMAVGVRRAVAASTEIPPQPAAAEAEATSGRRSGDASSSRDISPDLHLLLAALEVAAADPALADLSQTEKQTKLVEAAINNKPESITALVEAGADVNATDKDGVTALMWAARHNSPGSIKALVEAKANVNAKDNNGYTALMLAARCCHAGAITALVEAGADLEARNNEEQTALIKAAVDKGKAILIQKLREEEERITEQIKAVETAAANRIIPIKIPPDCLKEIEFYLIPRLSPIQITKAEEYRKEYVQRAQHKKQQKHHKRG